MKNLSLAICLFISYSFFGQNVICVQGASPTTFFTDLEEALDFAQDSDTLFIPSGNYTLPTTEYYVLDKELHLIGNGFDTDSAYTIPTTINSPFKILSGASGGSLEGIAFPLADVSIGFLDILSTNVSNFHFHRCQFVLLALGFNQPGNMSSNITISNCLIRTLDGNAVTNALISNCLIGNEENFGSDHIDQFNLVENVTFTNNILTVQNFSFDVSNCNFENNFIYLISSANNGNDSPSSNNFSNNLFLGNSFVSGGTQIDNLYEQDLTVIFESVLSHNYYDEYYSHDFKLLPGSIAEGAGLDGVDIGIYDGLLPWKDGALPSLPSIREFTISPNTDQDGNLILNAVIRGQSN